jgi:DNA-binding protein H-NS
VQIDKQQIISMIRSQVQSGNQDQSGQAEQELPQQVDTDNQQHQQLLQKFGINPQDLIARFTGGGIPGM